MAKKKQVEEPISEEVMVGKKPRLSASQKESIPKEHEAGATGKELAEKYGCTIGTIYNIIKKSGEPLKKRGSKTRNMPGDFPIGDLSDDNPYKADLIEMKNKLKLAAEYEGDMKMIQVLKDEIQANIDKIAAIREKHGLKDS